MYQRVVGGKTLYQRLLLDKQLEAADPRCCGIKFGKRCFAKLRLDDALEQSSQGLDIRDESLTCSPSLLEAVRASRTSASRERLNQWLQTAGAPNQTELVGLLSHLLELRPWLGGSQSHTCVEGLT